MTQLFDTHAHYDDVRFDQDRDQTLQGLAGAGVALVLNPGADLESSRRAAALAEQYDFLYAAAGVHPHSASEFDDGQRAEIARLLERPRVKALGEIGLDYHYDTPPREVQKLVFEEQLKLAVRADCPVIIHSRDAAEDTMKLLRQYRPKGVLHCFSGSVETAREALELGLYLGFTGVVTFPSAKRAKAVAAMIPADRLLLETDCPYMAPVPFRGQRSTSDMIAYTAAAIGEARGVSAQEVINSARENTLRLFSIPHTL
ncbi:MAG: TatD family hydrolase [Clostridiaceae bacterium]|nr:TatD family hydrolase [Clostridiaceae bacterium]